MSPVTIRTFIRENAYRDFWLFAITVIALIAVIRVEDAVDQVQQERANATRRNCVEVNGRHDNTVRVLDRVLNRAGQDLTPAQRRDLEQSRAATILLIDALAPRRDCDDLVQRTVGSGR